MQITTIGYVNLETGDFYSTREEWLSSKLISETRKAKKSAFIFLKRIAILSALDVAKAKLKIGYTWDRFINYCKAKINVLRNKAQRILR